MGFGCTGHNTELASIEGAERSDLEQVGSLAHAVLCSNLRLVEGQQDHGHLIPMLLCPLGQCWRKLSARRAPTRGRIHSHHLQLWREGTGRVKSTNNHFRMSCMTTVHGSLNDCTCEIASPAQVDTSALLKLHHWINQRRLTREDEMRASVTSTVKFTMHRSCFDCFAFCVRWSRSNPTENVGPASSCIERKLHHGVFRYCTMIAVRSKSFTTSVTSSTAAFRQHRRVKKTHCCTMSDDYSCCGPQRIDSHGGNYHGDKSSGPGHGCQSDCLDR